ncbi:hypothetical protein G5C51_42045, partial [Streptomyces sp. A7024]|nr:hypothetical protein [Streptomyces coryli]
AQGAQGQGKPDVPEAREAKAQDELTAAKSGSLSQDAFQALLNKIEKVRRPESPA